MMNKTLISLAVASVLPLGASTAYAALPVKAQINFDAGVQVCAYSGTFPDACAGGLKKVVSGSFFTMDQNADGIVSGSEQIPLVMNAGIQLGGTQAASGSHSGAPGTGGTTEFPGIDAPWFFFSNTGMHQTNTAVTANTDNGLGNVELDFTGWAVTWNFIPNINMGGGIQDCGTSTDGICVGNPSPGVFIDIANVGGLPYNNGPGTATLTCFTDNTYTTTTDCVDGTDYQLDYAATVPQADPSNFGGVSYTLHFEGILNDRNQAPVAVTDPLPSSVVPLGSVRIDAVGNATDAADTSGDDGIDPASVVVAAYTGSRVPVPTIEVCTAAATPNALCQGEGDIIYTDNENTDTTVTADFLSYTVTDGLGKIIATPITVNMDVITGNLPPTCGNNVPVTTNVSTAINIDVAGNASDSDNGVDIASVVTSNPILGTPGTPTAGGFVNFVPTSAPGTASFDYTVKDNSGAVCGTPGTITINVNALPVAVNDGPVNVERNSASGVIIDVTGNDTDLEDTTVDKTTVAIPGGLSTGNGGTLSIDGATGEITYVPAIGYLGTDSFTYTVKDSNGATSLPATVSIDVVNALPIAVNDTASVNTASATFVDIDVTSNDTDADGGIVASSVNATQGSNGSTSVNGLGVVTYIPNALFIGPDQFTYTVNDVDGATSNAATVVVTVANSSLAVLDPAETLSFEPAVINGQTVPASGSYFTMEVTPGTLTFVALSSFNGVQLGAIQPGLAATPNVDAPWVFFGNVGVDQTTIAATILSDNGAGSVTLDFSGWNVSWNGIPSIPLNARAHSGGVDGVAVMACAFDCSTGDTYVLDYFATVPDRDPSGFGNVKYHLHLNGILGAATLGGTPLPPTVATIDAVDASGTTITVQPGDTAGSVGNTSGIGLTNNDIGKKDPLLNKGDGQQCIGGCIDFFVTGIVPGSYADLSFYLTEAIPSGAVYRKLMNGIWQGFDKSAGDQVGSGVATNGFCQPANGEFAKDLRPGNQCVFLRIFDGGPNDADGIANGTIVDPSGVLLPGTSNSPESSTNGCSISRTPAKLTERADWLIVAAFIGLLAIVRIRRKQAD